jgi:hypothetical protein
MRGEEIFLPRISSRAGRKNLKAQPDGKRVEDVLNQ